MLIQPSVAPLNENDGVSDPRPGEPAQHNPDGKLISDAHISCTLPEVFKDVKLKEPVFLNDGKIEGIIYLTKSDEQFIREYQVDKKNWF